MGVITERTDKYQSCIDACNRCSQACLECMKLCLNEADVAARKDHIAMLMECARICKETACMMVLESKHVKEICKFCTSLCDKCGSSCLTFQDEHCKKCAEECKNCANTCRAMLFSA